MRSLQFARVVRKLTNNTGANTTTATGEPQVPEGARGTHGQVGGPAQEEDQGGAKVSHLAAVAWYDLSSPLGLGTVSLANMFPLQGCLALSSSVALLSRCSPDSSSETKSQWSLLIETETGSTTKNWDVRVKNRRRLGGDIPQAGSSVYTKARRDSHQAPSQHGAFGAPRHWVEWRGQGVI